MKRITLGIVGLCLLGIIGSGAAIPRPPKIAPPATDPVENVLQAAQIGQPWTEGGLTVFPVRLDRTPVFGPVLTADEALQKNLLTIKEIGSGEVNKVTAVNKSDRHVFLMAGQAVSGAKQDRIISEDTLLAPNSATDIAVWCVEHSRWSGAPEFGASKFIAPAAVRQTAATLKSQTGVWDKVAEVQRAVGAPDGSLATAVNSEKVRVDTQPYRDKLLSLPDKCSDTYGVIVAYGNEFLAADIFYSATLFERLWPKLLDSYLLEVAGRAKSSGRPSVADAEKFLGQLYWAKPTGASTPGVGRRVELRADAVYGSALIMKNSVVHLEAFPALQMMQLQMPESGPSLQYRKERLENHN